MTAEQYIAIAATILLLVVLPLGMAYTAWQSRHVKASDRPSHTSAGAAFLGALDRLIRPSVEHQIKEENRVVKDEDDIGGK